MSARSGNLSGVALGDAAGRPGRWRRLPVAGRAVPAGAAPRRQALRVNFAWTFLGNGVYAGCQWGMLVVLAKLGTPTMVGQFALGLAIAAPVFMLTNLNLRGVQVTDARRAYAFADYLGLRLLGTLAALAATAAIAALAGYRSATLLVVLLVALAKAVESLSDVYQGSLQQQECMQVIGKALILKGLLSLLALGLAVRLTGSLVWGALGLVVAWLALLLGYELPNAARAQAALAAAPGAAWRLALRPRWHPATLLALIRLAAPLGYVLMLGSLNVNLPRYLLAHARGEHDLGIFAALSYLPVAGGITVAALGQAASPRLAARFAADDRAAFRALLARLVAIGAALGAAGVLVALVAGPLALRLVYSPEYARHADVLTIVMLSAVFTYAGSLLGYGITAMRIFAGQILPFTVAAALVAIAAWVLIPAAGLTGAAWVLVVNGLAVLLAPAFILLRRREDWT